MRYFRISYNVTYLANDTNSHREYMFQCATYPTKDHLLDIALHDACDNAGMEPEELQVSWPFYSIVELDQADYEGAIR